MKQNLLLIATSLLLISGYGGGGPLLVKDTVIYTAQGVMTGEITDHSVILQTRLTASPGPVNGDVPGKKGIARMALDVDSTFPHPRYTDWNTEHPATPPKKGKPVIFPPFRANSRAGRLAGDPNSTDPDSLIHQYFVQGPGQASGGFLNIRQQTDQGVSKLIFTFYDEHGKVHYSVTREIN
jgi:hypothetical protein